MIDIKETIIEIAAGSINDERTAEIYRNLTVLYGTQTGEQALDREFGIDINVVSAPQENAQALLTAEYVRKTHQYEPRARVVRVDWTAGAAVDGNMRPKVVIEIV